jgi:NAD(P)-dependent dehydrogenase (short-subunit alcohol dehydrogenase family)
MIFQPRTAIVTASDSGIGRATVVALAAAGLDIGVTWHSDGAGAQDTAAEARAAGARVEVTHLDTSELAECGNAIDDLADRLGGAFSERPAGWSQLGEAAGSSPSPASTNISRASGQRPMMRPSTVSGA